MAKCSWEFRDYWYSSVEKREQNCLYFRKSYCAFFYNFMNNLWCTNFNETYFSGEMNVAYLFTRYRFNWDEVDFSIFSTYSMVTNLVGKSLMYNYYIIEGETAKIATTEASTNFFNTKYLKCHTDNVLVRLTYFFFWCRN